MSLMVKSSKRDTLVFRGFQTVKSWIQTRLSGCGTRSANVQWNRAYCRKRYHRVTRGDARNYGMESMYGIVMLETSRPMLTEWLFAA